ncbi:MAG: SDR family oxidoreductase [Gammaproteobacteria bacterium]|nr:SDR family oxidoreductase [Gammaproteobacteria bacterium]
MLLSLRGKVAIITGANQGLGLEIARKYISSGASIVICARNNDLLQKARLELSGDLITDQLVEAKSIDVSDSDSVDYLVEAVLQQFGHIDILVNNAGIYGPMGPIETLDWTQWIKTIEINVFGSILMCKAVLPVMKKQQKGKIIQISGGGATNPMPNISAYAVSKAAIARFAETLAEEVREYHIDVNAIAPGALNTRMLDEVLTAGPDKVGRAFFDRSIKQKVSGGAGFSHGGDLAVFLASDLSNGITGKLISAVWDNWKHWPEHLAELSSSDAYTLRRIAGRDRGFAWGDK